jgi:hypothetical protein
MSVDFRFVLGAGLPDPKKLLMAEGKRLRHVNIMKKTKA